MIAHSTRLDELSTNIEEISHATQKNKLAWPGGGFMRSNRILALGLLKPKPRQGFALDCGLASDLESGERSEPGGGRERTLPNHR
jgi:hypothetical protein